MADNLIGWWLALAQALVFVAAAPLLTGWVRRVKCLLQNRKAAPLVQPYLDLAKLFRKEAIVSNDASWIFRAAPYVVFAATLVAASVIPLVTAQLPTAALADVIVLVGLFGLARFFLALAGMDTGTAFGGMGASRDMTVGSLAEPAMLMAIFTVSVIASSTNLSFLVEKILQDGLVLRPSLFFAAMGLVMVAVAEAGRIPVDNPDTHLELTMMHEAMTLEYSGRHLALIEWAAQVKLMIYGVLIANIFLPWGIATDFAPAHLGVGVLAVGAKLALLAVVLGLAEILMAKMRLFRAPLFLNVAFLLSLLGMLSHIVLEVGHG